MPPRSREAKLIPVSMSPTAVPSVPSIRYVRAVIGRWMNREAWLSENEAQMPDSKRAVAETDILLLKCSFPFRVPQAKTLEGVSLLANQRTRSK